MMRTLLFLVLISYSIPNYLNAQCAAQDIEGKWVNEDPLSRSFYRIDIEFPCYDIAGQTGPEAILHVYGVCYPSPCDWGTTNATNLFVSWETGWPTTTSLDATYYLGFATVKIVVLRLASDRLLVYSSTDYIEEIDKQDFSRIEYFKPMDRWVNITQYPRNQKQGDIMTFALSVGDQEYLDRINYTINNVSGVLQQPNFNIDFNTCKSNGEYYTTFSLQGNAVYVDGESVPFGAIGNLTHGSNSREDTDREFGFYVAEDTDQGFEERNINRANAFIDEFDSYSKAHYVYAEPWMYTTNAIQFTNSVDLAISIGHGHPHTFVTGNGDVDISGTEYGNFAPCHRTGDLEYLAFVSCQTLSIAGAFETFWLHNNNTRLEARPFTGLHMLLGFTTDVVFTYWALDDDGEDFLRTFAKYLDYGLKVKDAWLYATNDELSIDNEQNKSAVLYMTRYEHDRLNTVQDDYIFGNPQYTFYIEHW